MPRVEIGDTAERARNFAGRTWVLERVIAWLDDRNQRILLITGEPGSGKTALAAWLAGGGPAPLESTAQAQLERIRDAWSAAHFCTTDTRRGALDPKAFAQSLARQLGERYPDFAAAALLRAGATLNVEQNITQNLGEAVAVRIENFITTDRAEDFYNRTIRDPLETFARKRPTEPILILVDALDEALTFGTPNIVDLLAGSDDLPQSVRLVLTSRNEPRVVNAFRGVPRINISDADGQRQSQADIDQYVAGRMSRDALWVEQPEAVRQRVAAQLVQRADGNFLYVRFVLDEIAARRRKAGDLAGLPAGLNGLYRDYLDRLLPDMRAYRSSPIWTDQFQPLLGCLSVANPAAPFDVLPGWLGRTDGEVSSWLRDVVQLTEVLVDDEDHGYRLYHASMAEFLGKPRYLEAGNDVDNDYYSPPRDAHQKIVRYYVETLRGDWATCDAYGLRHLVGHLQARLQLAAPAERRQRADELYRLVLDPGFRAVQGAGDAQAALADLRSTLQIALERGDLMEALACIGAYRAFKAQSVTGTGVTDRVFSAVDAWQWDAAVRAAEHFEREPDWARALHLFIAWQAAASGDAAAAARIAEKALKLPLSQGQTMCDALLVRTAETLAAQAGGRSAADWLADWGQANRLPDLLATYTLPVAPDPATREGLVAQLDKELSDLEAEIDSPEAISAGPFLSDASAATKAISLRDGLVRLATDPAGQAGIDRALRLFVANPYPRYRDIALIALGVAVLAVPDLYWARERVRAVLRTGLDVEGVTFTFDLPSVLLAETERRGIGIPELTAYVDRARQQRDRWGSAARFRGGQALAAFRQGNLPAAVAHLRDSETHLDGFAGYVTTAALGLASRWLELGFPWSPEAARAWTRAADHAARVRDTAFREDRQALVQQYHAWAQQDVVDVDAALEALAGLLDHDARSVYIDYLAARWAAPGPRPPNMAGLKALVPAALVDGTRLDSLLGRLFGLSLTRFDDAQVERAARLCAEQLTGGRPWEVGPAVRSFA